VDKKDALVLAGIFTAAGIAVSFMVLVANGIIGHPFLTM